MTIHRIQVPPALDARTTGELADNLERAAAQPGGVILLAGAGGTFCRGMDFTALLAAEDAGTLEAECARSVAAFVECVWLIRSCGKPVVAVVDGPGVPRGARDAGAWWPADPDPPVKRAGRPGDPRVHDRWTTALGGPMRHPVSSPRRATAAPGRVRAMAGGVRGGRSPLRLKRLGGHIGAPHDDR